MKIEKADRYWIRSFIHFQPRAAGIVEPVSCHRWHYFATHCSARLREPGGAGPAVSLATWHLLERGHRWLLIAQVEAEAIINKFCRSPRQAHMRIGFSVEALNRARCRCEHDGRHGMELSSAPMA